MDSRCPSIHEARTFPGTAILQRNPTTVAAGFRGTVLSIHTLRIRKLQVRATTADMQHQYMHQRPDWPALTRDGRALAAQLSRVSHLKENLLGRVHPLEFHLRQQATLETLTSEVVKTSAIEGEFLDPTESAPPSPGTSALAA